MTNFTAKGRRCPSGLWIGGSRDRAAIARLSRRRLGRLLEQGALKARGDPISMRDGNVIAHRRSAATGTAILRDRIMTAKTSFRGSFTALVTPFKNGSVDEKAFRELGRLADRRGHQAGSFRSAPPAKARRSRTTSTTTWSSGASTKRKGRVPVVAGAGSNSTKEAIELARACRGGRRRRGARGHALLQQADAGRPLSALQGDQRCDRHSDHHLQYPAALGDRHVGRHDAAALRA